jgi:LysR family transcriptional regulator, nitrogen assimilation regulatory protein
LGSAVLARSTVGMDLLEKRVHARRIVEPSLTRDLYLIMLAEHPQTRAFTEVRQVLTQVFLLEVSGGRWPAQTLGTRRKR